MSEGKLAQWQDEILDNVQKFASATEINFRRLYAESQAKDPPGVLAPTVSSFVLNSFCDGLMGITAHLVCTFVGTSLGAEEIAVKALRKKCADFRSNEIRKKLTAVPNETAQRH